MTTTIFSDSVFLV